MSFTYTLRMKTPAMVGIAVSGQAEQSYTKDGLKREMEMADPKDQATMQMLISALEFLENHINNETIQQDSAAMKKPHYAGRME